MVMDLPPPGRRIKAFPLTAYSRQVLPSQQLTTGTTRTGRIPLPQGPEAGLTRGITAKGLDQPTTGKQDGFSVDVHYQELRLDGIKKGQHLGMRPDLPWPGRISDRAVGNAVADRHSARTGLDPG
jgi:hypothetical protein